jgi:hypothetical protein
VAYSAFSVTARDRFGVKEDYANPSGAVGCPLSGNVLRKRGDTPDQIIGNGFSGR